MGPEDQVSDEDREKAKLLRRMLEAQNKLEAESASKVPQGYKLLQETPDGGKIYKAPDGKLSFTSSNYATNNQAEILRMLQGATPAAARRSETNKEIVQQSGWQAGAASAIQGLPFIGQYFDEAAGMVTGDPRVTSALRENAAAHQEQKPLEAFAGQAGLGTVATLPLVPFQAAGRALQTLPTLGQKLLTGLGVGVSGGAIEGGVSGFGAGEGSAEERMPSAVMGAGMGGALGGLFGLAAPAGEAGVKNALQFWGDKPIRDMAKQFGISPDAAKVVIAAIQDNDIPTAQAALQRAGSTSMLGEATQGTKNLLDAAIAMGSGTDRAQQALLARNLRGEQEMRGAFNRFLGNPEDIKDVTGKIRLATKEEREQLYNAAYDKQIDYSTLTGQQLQNMLRLVPPEALRYANKIRSMDPNARAPQIVFTEGPDGSVSFGAAAADAPPSSVTPLKPAPKPTQGAAEAASPTGAPQTRFSVEQWDLITRGLNEMAYGSPAGAMGGKSEIQSLAAKNAREIRKIIMDQVPEYRAALGLARDTIEEVKSAEVGFNLLNGGTTVKEVKDMLSGNNPAAAQSMKLGLRSGLDHALGNLKVSAANPNTDIKELMAGLSSLRSRNNMSKVRALLGDADADEFCKVLDQQATGIELAAAVAANSKTAQRLSVGRSVEEIAAPGILGSLLRAEPVNASRMVIQSITGKTPEADAARRMGLYDDIATLLTRVQGQSARDALNLIEQAKAGKALNDVQAAIIAKAVTMPAAIGTYKAMTNAQVKPVRPQEATYGRQTAE